MAQLNPLPHAVLTQATDALACVLSLLTEWGAHELTPYKRAWMEEGQRAVTSREEYPVRESLLELLLILNELADSKDDEVTFRVVAQGHAAMDAIRKANITRGRRVA
jgi:hypothetical protein